MIEDIRKNTNTEIGMLREIAQYTRRLDFAGPTETRLLTLTIKALRESIVIVNNSIPQLISEILIVKKLPSSKTPPIRPKLENLTYRRGESEFRVTISSKDKDKLLNELKISETNIKKLKKRESQFKEEYLEFKAARGYLKLANKYFLDYANKLIKKGYFQKISKELRKANIDMLFPAYIAMMFLTTFLSIFVGIFILIFLLIFDLGITFPFINIYKGNYLIRLLQLFWIPIITPPLVALAIYYYPSTEKQTLKKKINQELPFAVIHMSAISGSGIQPSEIFRIIGLSQEYPYLRKEIRKVLNQINLYGYDLVTALINTAGTTSSDKLAELLSGLATTITTGGDLSEFFDKRSETLLAGYRLEREKYIKTAETFMDIYISVVIAAPMILMLLLVILTVGQFDIPFTTSQLTILILSAISILNIGFLAFLHINQPIF